jgi:hypothetical protein
MFYLIRTSAISCNDVHDVKAKIVAKMEKKEALQDFLGKLVIKINRDYFFSTLNETLSFNRQFLNSSETVTYSIVQFS